MTLLQQVDLPLLPGPRATPAAVSAPAPHLTDKFGRTITDLRVSITDRCNYKCVYCRTGTEGARFAELALSDYLRIIRVFVGLGIQKIRLTGGEPLLRKGIVELVQQLAELRHQGENAFPLDIAITTNGHLLAEMAEPLARAGLSRVTVSMDAVDPATFARVTRVPGSFEAVLSGVRAARRHGLGPVKINCVLIRGFNEDQIIPFARFSREEGVIVRFIEFMPLDEDSLWNRKAVVTLDEVVSTLHDFGTLVSLPATASGETARRFTFADGIGEIGVIAPVSQAFCGACSRIRLTSDGKIRTCLFSHFDHDLYSVLVRGGSDDDISAFIQKTVTVKEARHHIGEPDFLKPSRSMVHIGG